MTMNKVSNAIIVDTHLIIISIIQYQAIIQIESIMQHLSLQDAPRMTADIIKEETHGICLGVLGEFVLKSLRAAGK